MYDKGQGVVQDYAEAVKWYRLAAQQGDASAQYNLGLMYARGEGVVQDYVKGHSWFNLGAASGNANAVKGRDIVAKLMTPQQIGDAQKLARDCQARQLKGCD
jgi:TPR repeat protein